MSEKEKKILETIATAVPKMSEFDKGTRQNLTEESTKQFILLFRKHRKNGKP